MGENTGSGRAQEQPAVRTTIVGGRPPGSGKKLGEIPRGIEVLVKKASVDAQFRRALIEKRAEAAREIGLALDPAEALMLRSVPREQLEAIIHRTKVSPRIVPAFLGRAAGVMLAALGVGTMGCCDDEPPTFGLSPEDPGGKKQRVVVLVGEGESGPRRPDRLKATDGVRPDPPPEIDLDQDGIADSWEEEHFSSIDECDPDEDTDVDGLTNLQEYQHGTDPRKQDTDGDGYSDGDEVALGSDPLDKNSTPKPQVATGSRPDLPCGDEGAAAGGLGLIAGALLKRRKRKRQEERG